MILKFENNPLALVERLLREHDDIDKLLVFAVRKNGEYLQADTGLTDGQIQELLKDFRRYWSYSSDEGVEELLPGIEALEVGDCIELPPWPREKHFHVNLAIYQDRHDKKFEVIPNPWPPKIRRIK